MNIQIILKAKVLILLVVFALGRAQASLDYIFVDGLESLPGGPRPALPHEQQNTYTIDLIQWNIQNDGGGDSTVNTNNIQAAIDWALEQGYGAVKLPAGEYLVGKYGNNIYQAGIVLRDNMVFELDENAVIQMAQNDKWNYCVLDVTDREHVVIRGGAIRGDRDNHIYTPRPSDGSTVHDEGHLICIKASQYVLVEDTHLSNANGDGILLVANSQTSTLDTTIRNNEFDNNRRQGISIVGAIRVLVENNEIHDTHGTPPQFGIDIESLSYESRDIKIRNNLFYANGTTDTAINYGGGHIVNTDGRNVLIEYNTMEQRGIGRGTDGSIVYWKNADQTIRYNYIKVRELTVNLKVGIIQYSNTAPKTNPATTYIHDNVCDGCGFYMYQSADLDIRRNVLTDGYLAFRDFENLTLIDNQVDSTINACWAFRFKNVLGYAEGNTYFGNPFELALSATIPFEYCWQ